MEAAEAKSESVIFLFLLVINGYHIPSDNEPSKSSTVQDLINRIKNDSQITDAAKLDTLSLLIMKFRKENDE